MTQPTREMLTGGRATAEERREDARIALTNELGDWRRGLNGALADLRRLAESLDALERRAAGIQAHLDPSWGVLPRDLTHAPL